MMVTFVAQCEKKALNKTRRVLDAFANRIGTRTWQTVITAEGLKAVKKLLRQTATKNSAISCHWIRSRSRSELVWIVGNRSKFNNEGFVPVNYTEEEICQYMDNYTWKTLPFIRYATVIAALFHDFGKAVLLFQLKLDPEQKTPTFEPYRHEWISLRLFQAFAENNQDEEWLRKLSQINQNQNTVCFRDGLDGSVRDNHPLEKLSPFAHLVAWLILSHHKLPIYPKWKDNANFPPKLKIGADLNVSNWLGDDFEALWNSHNCKDIGQRGRVGQNWECNKHGFPYKSMRWRSKICLIASEARVKLDFKQYRDAEWINKQLFTAHVSRLCLMLADHFYSAQDEVTEEWRNPHYEVWANTSRGHFKQQLDEHLIGVAHHAGEIAKALPKLNASLDELREKEVLESRVEKKFKESFGWQDEARRLSEKLAKSTISQGFFGINMASTGKGKTLANAKIMYAIGTGTGRKRFSVALGLRTLTLQTGREYLEKLELNDEELAIAVGGITVKQLFDNEQNKQKKTGEYNNDAESQDELVDADVTLSYQGRISEHSLSPWTGQERKLDTLIGAPVLVCTIDHLIPATEGTKGGRQIAPMLRLLTSDLVLDEPDDFGLEDLPALCRLVHWAGMLGSRVLLSTATMPPSLAYALFLAYHDGWREYAAANIADWRGEITCAWYDEYDSRDGVFSELQQFKSAHDNFVKKRVKNLAAGGEVRRKGQIVPVSRSESQSVIGCLAETIQECITTLHKDHHQSHNGKNISVGLVRMANIDPLVAVTRELLNMDVPDSNTCIHYCVYHSRYPLAIRSELENKLDRILKRKDTSEIWSHPEIDEKLHNSPHANHIFVVVASPVAEVGRDHDYDWAVVEPSSMRSIIQLAGRVLRHRSIVPVKPNVLLLSKNYKALLGKDICFVRPGFEISELESEKTHDLQDILTSEQFETITAIPRITGIDEYAGKTWSNLAEMEHKALVNQLFTGEKPANVWWKEQPQWCGEVQRQQRFRASPQDEAYCLFIKDEFCQAKWLWKNEREKPPKLGEMSDLTIEDITLGCLGVGNDFWFDLDAQAIYTRLVDDMKMDSLAEVSCQFGVLRIVEYGDAFQEYKYHPNLGVFREIGETNE